MPKLLVLVLSLDRQPWRSLESTQRTTWARPDANTPVLFVQGRARGIRRAMFLVARRLAGSARNARSLDVVVNRSAARLKSRVDGDVLQTRVPETWYGTGAKTVAAFRHVLANYDFDYILRTNSSTYIAINQALRFIEGLPRTRYYGGTPHSGSPQKLGETFAAGTGIVLSRDMVEWSAADPRWEYDLVDDLALGRSMARTGVSLSAINRVEVRTRRQLCELEKADLSKEFVYRCRGARDGIHDTDRAFDIEALNQIHRIVTGATPLD